MKANLVRSDFGQPVNTDAFGGVIRIINIY